MNKDNPYPLNRIRIYSYRAVNYAVRIYFGLVKLDARLDLFNQVGDSAVVAGAEPDSRDILDRGYRV